MRKENWKIDRSTRTLTRTRSPVVLGQVLHFQVTALFFQRGHREKFLVACSPASKSKVSDAVCVHLLDVSMFIRMNISENFTFYSTFEFDILHVERWQAELSLSQERDSSALLCAARCKTATNYLTMWSLRLYAAELLPLVQCWYLRFLLSSPFSSPFQAPDDHHLKVTQSQTFVCSKLSDIINAKENLPFEYKICSGYEGVLSDKAEGNSPEREKES